MLKKIKLNKNGTTVLELLTAITIISFALLIIVSFISSTFNQSIITEKKNGATYISSSINNFLESQKMSNLSNLIEPSKNNIHTVNNIDSCIETFTSKTICDALIFPTYSNYIFAEGDINILISKYDISYNNMRKAFADLNLPSELLDDINFKNKYSEKLLSTVVVVKIESYYSVFNGVIYL